MLLREQFDMKVVDFDMMQYGMESDQASAFL
jgi:hypothetical protein